MKDILRFLGIAKPEIICVEFPPGHQPLDIDKVCELVEAVKDRLGYDAKVIVLQNGATMKRI